MNPFCLAQTPWEGSGLVLQSASGQGSPVMPQHDVLLLMFLIVSVALVIACYRSYAEGLAGAFRVCSGYNRALEVFNDRSMMKSVNVAFFLTIPFFAYTCCKVGVSSLNFWYVLLVVVSFFLLRHVIYAVTAWLTGRDEPFQLLERTSLGCSLLPMAFSVPALVVFRIFPTVPEAVFGIYIAALCVFGAVVYFVRSYKIFTLSRFSSFFWFLYLCSLEILPMCVAINILVSNGY